jgi:hypothetical protein
MGNNQLGKQQQPDEPVEIEGTFTVDVFASRRVSDELAAFMGTFPQMTKHCALEVAERMKQHIHSHCHYVPLSHLPIVCDVALARLLRLDAGEEAEWYILQHRLFHYHMQWKNGPVPSYAMRRGFFPQLKADLLRWVMHPRNVHRLAGLQLI